jgi:DNA recombination protein RmuC
MEIIVIVMIGALLLGAVAVLLRRQQQHAVAVQAAVQAQQQQLEMRDAFGARELHSKKELIDQELVEVRSTLERLQAFFDERDHRHHENFGQVITHLQETARQTQALTDTTQSLREALSSTTARGQWGERMAEDVLRLAGFIEGKNYRRHRAIEGSGRVPDFTFLLPQGLCMHMDVKFPHNNYQRYLDAVKNGSELDQERWRKAFLKDVRERVKEVAVREYVDTGAGTVDCMLLFVPNEQVYAFIQEQDRDILDDALRSKIIFCSPLTLYAVLAVIRQSVDNFQLEQTAQEILALLLGIERQWDRFVEQMTKVGRNLRTATNAFDELEGTRRNQLERQFDKIGDLRRQQEIGTDENSGPTLALEA